MIVIRVCEICQGEFKKSDTIIKKGKGRFCSKVCFNKHKEINKPNNRGFFRECEVCKKEVYVIPSYNRRFCSRKCMAVGREYNITEETREKIRLSQLGKPSKKRNGKMYACPTCGKETYCQPSNLRGGRRFCSMSCRAKGLPDPFEKTRGCTRGRRKENPKTDESCISRKRIEYIEWRNSVFKRDDWTCKKCNKKGGDLHPHHILNFAEHKDLRYDVSNGITLCVIHHKQFHKKYGKKGNSEYQILDFLKPI